MYRQTIRHILGRLQSGMRICQYSCTIMHGPLIRMPMPLPLPHHTTTTLQMSRSSGLHISVSVCIQSVCECRQTSKTSLFGDLVSISIITNDVTCSCTNTVPIQYLMYTFVNISDGNYVSVMMMCFK